MSEEPDKETTSYARSYDAGHFKDPLLGIRPAGKSTTIFMDTAERDLKSEIYFKRPDTPPEQRKFRKNLVPGEINSHWGLTNQKLPKESFRYGIKSDKGETVERTFKAGQLLGIEAYKNSCAESVYDSTKREPLGAQYIRGHVLPDVTKEPDFPGFGLKSKDVEDGKLVIFPRGVVPDSEETRKQYQFTHGNYLPGEMAKRNYNWPDAVTKNEYFRFGVTEKDCGGEVGGVKGALDFERDEHAKINKTRIGRATLDDYRNVSHDLLGRSKNYCQGKPRVPPKGFGIVSAGANDTAAACIQGTYPLEEQQPDEDLGKCLIVGRRNYSKIPGRVFGVPSVRVDIPAPIARSCADNQNYGDEVGARPLLNPQRFEQLGIPDKEFLIRRDKAETKEILENSGYDFGADFDEMWKTAIELFNDGVELVSLDAMIYLYGKKIEQKVEEKIRA